MGLSAHKLCPTIAGHLHARAWGYRLPRMRWMATLLMRPCSRATLIALSCIASGLLAGCGSLGAGIGIGVPILPGVSLGVGVGSGGINAGVGAGVGPIGVGVGVNQRGQVSGGVGAGTSMPLGGSNARVGVGVGTGTVLYDPEAREGRTPKANRSDAAH